MADPIGWWRIAAASNGTIAIGSTQPGRGAWICSAACFDTAVRRNSLERALRRRVSSAEITALRATLVS